MENKTETKKKKKFFSRIAKKKLEWFIFFLCTTIAVLILWPFCAVVVEAGQTGVYFNTLAGGTVLDSPRGEGLHFKLPWDLIIQYDSRLQSKDYEVDALTSGGLAVKINMSVIWLVQREQAPYLHVSTGPDYVTRVIDPAVRSTVRSIIGSYEQSYLYDRDPLMLQNDVMTLLKETLKSDPFTIQSILIREVVLPETMSDAISYKFVAEQDVLAARYRVLESIELFKKNYVNAESTRVAQAIVNEGMSEAYLRFLGIQATLELSQSHNAKLVIIGDKDGMPLILNPDSLDVSMALPDGLTREEYIPEGLEGSREEELMETYNTMQEYLELIDSILGDLVGEFPEAEPGIGDTNVPHESQVPRNQGEED